MKELNKMVIEENLDILIDNEIGCMALLFSEYGNINYEFTFYSENLN